MPILDRARGLMIETKGRGVNGVHGVDWIWEDENWADYPLPKAKPVKVKPQVVAKQGTPITRLITAYAVTMDNHFKANKGDLRVLEDYQISSNEVINPYLRKGTYVSGVPTGKPLWHSLLRRDKDMGTSIEALDRATNLVPLPEDTVVWRGAQAKFYKDMKPGTLFTDHGFGSTTLSQEKASVDFMPSGGVLMRIEAPAGTKAVFASLLGAKGVANGKAFAEHGQQEILMARDTKYKVISIDHTKKPAVITLRVVLPTAKKAVVKKVAAKPRVVAVQPGPVVTSVSPIDSDPAVVKAQAAYDDFIKRGRAAVKAYKMTPLDFHLARENAQKPVDRARARARVKAGYPKVPGIEQLSYEGQEDMCVTLLKTYAEYPKLKATKVGIRHGYEMPDGLPTGAVAVTMGNRNAVYLNSDVVERGAKASKKGWSFTHNVGDCLTHEMGHAIIIHYINGDPKPVGAHRFYRVDRLLNPIYKDLFPDQPKVNISDPQKWGSDAIAHFVPKGAGTLGSKYAMTDMHEFLAEAWLAYKQGSTKPAHVAIGKMMEKELRK